MQNTRPPESPPRVQCSDCKIDTETVMGVPFRVGGSGAISHLLFGNWAEMGEELLSFNLYICRQCGKVQLYADRKTRETLQMD